MWKLFELIGGDLTWLKIIINLSYNKFKVWNRKVVINNKDILHDHHKKFSRKICNKILRLWSLKKFISFCWWSKTPVITKMRRKKKVKAMLWNKIWQTRHLSHMTEKGFLINISEKNHGRGEIKCLGLNGILFCLLMGRDG